MTISWLGALITFQVTFTELFIAASVMLTGAYRFGWRSILAGSVVGALAVAALAVALRSAAYLLALNVIDWISAVLLLGFGLYLAYEFVDGYSKRRAGDAAASVDGHWNRPLNAAGLGVAAWALVAEGLEILVVWLGVALREGAGTATLGVGLGLAVVVGAGLVLGGTGVYRKVTPYVLDGVAAVMVLGYGAYFTSLAIMQS
ncbi:MULTISPECIES: hypothetical protein [unclassified Methylobacterium]|jgi:uncharacterized membrane protein|uniref:hypothetical protein n=1 Tax=unclassified Methylobacterium TaxID=2615210 RepID=UPI0006FA3788|nr:MULTISPECIES: hypothetical protein [unclassified Methylobacterium]KQO49603.1 hypothetical protein ASF08_23120 [Methylobacterium sp. Leaf85]MCJ2043206.1 hypothetical protein [Methylobacterium sp. J-078]